MFFEVPNLPLLIMYKRCGKLLFREMRISPRLGRVNIAVRKVGV